MEHETRTLSYETVGIDCPRRADGVREAVSALRGVERVSLSHVTGRLTVSLAEGVDETACMREILSTVRAAGGELVLSAEEVAELAPPRSWLSENYESVLTAVSGIALVLGLAVAKLFGNSAMATPAYLVSAVTGMAAFVPVTVASIRMGRPDAGMLAVLATVASLGIGFVGESTAFLAAALVAVLHQVARWVGAWAMRRAAGAVTEPLEILPEVTHLVDGDAVQDVGTGDVPVGALVRILPGETVPLDGIVEAGSASVDACPLTGSHVHVGRGIGAEVLAGTVNVSGIIDVRVKFPAGESAAERAAAKAIDAQEEEIPYASAAARVADACVSIAIAAAVLVGVWLPLHMSLMTGEILAGQWIEWACKACALLVIASPGSLMLAAPVAFVSAMSLAARRGVLVDGAEAMANVSRATVICVDKTGTLTTGHPEVSHVIPLDGTDGTAMLSVAAALVSGVAHPLARAVSACVTERGVAHAHADDPVVTAGVEVSGRIDGAPFRIGRVEAVVDDMGSDGDDGVIRRVEALRGAGLTVLAVANESSVLGLLGIADKPRVSAASAVSGMRRVRGGKARVEMLTGDNGGAVALVAEATGVDESSPGLTAEGKRAHVAELVKSGETVLAIGGTSCDASLLEAASVGVSLGVRPADAPSSPADVTVASGALGRVAWFVRTSVRAARTARIGIAVAVVTKLSLVALVLAGVAGTGETAVAEVVVMLVVALSGLWLLQDFRRQ